MKKLSKIALSVSLLGLGVNVVAPLSTTNLTHVALAADESQYKDIYDTYVAKIKESAKTLANEYMQESVSMSQEEKQNLILQKTNVLAALPVEGISKMAALDLPEALSLGSKYSIWSQKLTQFYTKEGSKLMWSYINDSIDSGTSTEITSQFKPEVSSEEKVEKVLPEKMTTPTESVDIKLPGLNEKEVTSEEGRIIETQPISEYSSGSAANKHHKHKHHFSDVNEQQNIDNDNKSTSSNTVTSSTTATQTESVAKSSEKTVATAKANANKSLVKTETKKVLPKTSAVK